MIALEEARQRLLARVRATPPEVVSIAEAWDRVTAAPATARVAHPPHDVSAMDGYAVRSADAAAAGARLRVLGVSAAGHPWTGPPLGPGECLRIFTGSVVPQGADAVLIQENAAREGDDIAAIQAVVVGQNIRPAGQDFSDGAELVQAGRRMTARDVGLAAAGNTPWVTVHRRPRVGILATGDEIAQPGEQIGPGGIVGSNSLALAGIVRGAGGVPVVFPHAPDDPAALRRAAAWAVGLDLLVTIGGASVGEHDLVRSALQQSGMVMDFWTVAMRPGKPLMHGDLAGLQVIGLPGNPVSAIVAGLLFVRPMIERLTGLRGDPPSAEAARLASPLPANDQRADHLRARLEPASDGTLLVHPFPRQDSAMMRLMAQADALILRPPRAPHAPEGSMVQVIRLAAFGL